MIYVMIMHMKMVHFVFLNWLLFKRKQYSGIKFSFKYSFHYWNYSLSPVHESIWEFPVKNDPMVKTEKGQQNQEGTERALHSNTILIISYLKIFAIIDLKTAWRRTFELKTSFPLVGSIPLAFLVKIVFPITRAVTKPAWFPSATVSLSREYTVVGWGCGPLRLCT